MADLFFQLCHLSFAEDNDHDGDSPNCIFRRVTAFASCEHCGFIPTASYLSFVGDNDEDDDLYDDDDDDDDDDDLKASYPLQ